MWKPQNTDTLVFFLSICFYQRVTLVSVPHLGAQPAEPPRPPALPRRLRPPRSGIFCRGNGCPYAETGGAWAPWVFSGHRKWGMEHHLGGGLEHFHTFFTFPYVGNNHPNWPIDQLTIAKHFIFQRGWNHQPVIARWVMNVSELWQVLLYIH